MKAVMDALSPRHPAQRVVFLKAAQVGATVASNNWIGVGTHRAPGPFFAAQPTVDLAKRLSQQRINPLMRMARTCANAWNLPSCALREMGRCLRNSRAALFC
jgi:phage terminase large subunit GpA-like protein